MSDPAVITIFKTVLATTTAPYLETLNVRPNNMPDTFSTIERDHAEVQRITLGTPTQFRELGVLQVVVHVRAGIGDSAAQTLAEEIRNAFHNFASGYLQILEVNSAVVYAPDEGNFFELKIPVSYLYDFFKP